jgi:hypothetical protein
MAKPPICNHIGGDFSLVFSGKTFGFKLFYGIFVPGMRGLEHRGAIK